MPFIFEETTTLDIGDESIYHHNRSQQGDYLAITDTRVVFETDPNQPNFNGIRKVEQFREEYMVDTAPHHTGIERAERAERLVATNSYTIDASTPEGKVAAQIVFELLLNTPTNCWE